MRLSGLTALGRCLRLLLWRCLPKKPKLIGFGATWTARMAMVSLLVLAAAGLLATLDGLSVLLKKLYEDWVFEWETTGQIIVDSPKVYTRERLVNDRLEEARWLESQLKKTDDELFSSRFQSVAGKLTTLRREQLSIAGQGAPQTPDAKAPAAERRLRTADQSEMGMQDPSESRELTVDRFRDLHTFREEVRATMMQTQLDDRHDLNGNTVYRLTFDTTIVAGPNTHDLAWIDVILTRQPSYDEDSDIFERWRAHIEKESRRLLTSHAAAFSSLSSPTPAMLPDTQQDLYNFLSDQICISIKTNCAKYIMEFTAEYVENIKNTLKDNLTIVFKNSENGIKDDKLYADKLYADYETFCKKLIIENTYRFDSFFTRTDVISQTNKHDTKKMPCKPYSDIFAYSNSFYRLFAIVDLYSRVTRMSKSGRIDSLLDPWKKEVCDWRNNKDRDKKTCPPLIPAENPDIIKCVIAQYTIYDLIRRAKPMLNFFRVHITGEDVDWCNIEIEKLGGAAPERKLKQQLSLNVTTFSYAVTPKNMVQRLGMISGDNDMLSILSGAKPGENLAAQAIAILQERSRKLEVAQGFPIIVGRGSNQPSSPGNESGIKARFGWVIAPSVRGGADQSSSRILQTTQQYTLAAVVSVPSWWHRVLLTYRTCWVDPRHLKLAAWSDLVECTAVGKPRSGTIDLPGKIDDISRKLGFWVLNAPNLDDETVVTLTAGRKESVVIRGTRLWRSTAVTLGGQKADKIEVLPNMNGIIATFNCLQAQEETISLHDLEVWTSEGKTPSKSVTVYPPNPSSSCSEDGTPLSVKAAADVPSLDDGQQWTLTGGRKQDIVVRGKRLWYGTVVTLGSQKADRIELLPGANGVIATFDCLQEQKEPTMLQAWTSEGVTRPVSVAVSRAEDGWYCENNRPKTAGPVAGRNDGASGPLTQPASGVAAQPSTTAGGTSAEGVPQVP